MLNMDYVIDIQDFRDAEKKFLPKEVAIVYLQKAVLDLDNTATLQLRLAR